LVDKYKGMAAARAGEGSSCLLWDDCWDGQPFKLTYPELHSFAKKKDICLANAITALETFNLFHLPLSVQAFEQLQLLEQCFASQVLIQGPDKWTYIWGNSNYSSSKAYKHLIGITLAHPLFRQIWKCSCQPNHKVFFWLLLQDRLSTKNLLRRKTMSLPSYSCVTCMDGNEETVEHLFLECALLETVGACLELLSSAPLTLFRGWKASNSS
jgi:hypothetical protein